MSRPRRSKSPNKFNARGLYVCLDCQRQFTRKKLENGKQEPRPTCEAGHIVHYFGSESEYKHYGALKLRMLANEIDRLELKPRFDLVVNGQKIGVYTGDYGYRENGQYFVDDVKGFMNAPQKEAFILRKKIVEATHNVQVRVVG